MQEVHEDLRERAGERMITGRDVYEHCPEGTVQPPYANISKEERAGYQQTAKEVNEGIWGAKVSTLKSILGTEPGTKAKTLKHTDFGSIWTTIEQHRTNRGDLFWVHYEGKGGDPTRLEEYDFKNIAFFYDVNEPIWTQA